jgi:protein TonB
MLMEAPAPPVQEFKPQSRPANATVVRTQTQYLDLQAPSKIPPGIKYIRNPEVLDSGGPISLDNGWGGPASPDNPFRGQRAVPVVQPPPKPRPHISSGVMAGLIVNKVTPAYPPIAMASHTEGTVVLQATISRNGTIENLRVASGSPLLQQAALDAVAQWRYKPYLLDGQPVEVETTVEVQFKLN